MAFERITVDPAVMGVPCTRGMRLPVAGIVAMVADGTSAAEIVDEPPDLVVEDVSESLHHAGLALREGELPLLRLSA